VGVLDARLAVDIKVDVEGEPLGMRNGGQGGLQREQRGGWRQHDGRGEGRDP